jgi:predicted 2-oxoglutarate/Fe(II)-dependent dioxygenase YbiX
VILQVRHAVSATTCTRLIEIFDGASDRAALKDYSGFPVLYVFKDRVDADSREYVTDVLADCRREIAAGLGVSHEVLHPETVILTALGVGGWHPRHVDNARLEDGRWVPNHTPYRSVSALLYLNDDFDGGEIVFDAQGLEIRPEPGLLVAFPSSFEYPHEVRPVTRGRRLSMPFWFTADPARALALP